MKLTFRTFSEINRQRCEAADGFSHPLDSWSLPDWFTATVGELGEAANVLKKLNRIRDGMDAKFNKGLDKAALQGEFKKEIGDTFIYLDLLAQAAGFTIEEAAVEAFNNKSAELCCPILMPITYFDE
jgi:NTP pyrophosphatase (non-canonical NTP hydrolase)